MAPAAWLLAAPLWALLASVRLRSVLGGEVLERVAAAGRPVVYTFWHNRLVVCGHLVQRRVVGRGGRLGMLTSHSRDGELAARLGRIWGVDVVRGSTSRGGLAGLRHLYRLVSRGGVSVVTAPDGPRGPRYQCQPGTVILAQTTGAPIVPMAYAVDRCWRLRSWDRLIVPRPFARAVVAVGEPVEVPRRLSDAERDAWTAELGRRLDALVERAEAAVTRAPA